MAASSQHDQLTKRNIIEAKKNKSMKWLDSQNTKQQSQTLQMAVDKRKEVKQWQQTHAKSIQQARQDAMLETIKKKKQKEQKNADFKDQLSKVMVIGESTELDDILRMIDDEDTSKVKKVARKKELLKVQIQLRRHCSSKKSTCHSQREGKVCHLTSWLMISN